MYISILQPTTLPLALSEGKKDRAVYKKYVNEGLKAAEHGLKLDPDHPKCHSWYAIFLNYVSQLEGVNKRIENSFKMKEHWMKAITADPDDAVTLHALGRWCYEVADLPWIKRKFAEAFFSSPPTSSYEEALKYLLDSETKSPKLIAENSLYLARTYHRLKRKDEAKKYCQRVLEFTADDLETEEAKKEVTALLKNL
ncbi:Regulator of microtubule dynamics protein 1 [Fasciola gigantica]|uniref:Regulator of microtubule dynamics protein 1 n=2 Tax=Fasciola TaxID=6191 RepID=A0A4E0RUK6_FASHE|nr:Regulator of microtubule dynamics protein 1 [Fasciola hepatica]TPP66109.1 Regulator of microtubule dynamics protein 1 [Fasciola gigantica]